MNCHQRVEGDDVEPQVPDSVSNGSNRAIPDCNTPVISRELQRDGFPTIEEEPFLQTLAVDSVVVADSADAALHLVDVVLCVPYPNAQAVAGFIGDQIVACRHAYGFDE